MLNIDTLDDQVMYLFLEMACYFLSFYFFDGCAKELFPGCFSLKDKVMVMMNQKLQQIEIRLDPQELGNVNVKINMQNEQAVVGDFLIL